MPSLSAISNRSVRAGILQRFLRKYSHRASICSGCFRTLVRFFFFFPLLVEVFWDFVDLGDFDGERYYFLLLAVFAAVVPNGVPLLIDSMPDLVLITPSSFSDFWSREGVLIGSFAMAFISRFLVVTFRSLGVYLRLDLWEDYSAAIDFSLLFVDVWSSYLFLMALVVSASLEKFRFD